MLLLVYYLTGHLAMIFLAIPPSNAAAIWPPAGISLAAVLLFGNRVLPAVFMGDLFIAVELFGFQDSLSITFSLMVGFQAGLSAWLGATLIGRFLGRHNPLIDNRSILLFLFLGGPVSQLLSAILAIDTELWLGIIKSGDVISSFFAWWIGSSLGVVLFAPLVFIFFSQPRLMWKSRIMTVAFPLIFLFIIGVWFFNFIKTTEQDRLQQVFNNYVETFHHGIIDKGLSLAGEQEKIKLFINAFSSISESGFRIVSQSALKNFDDISALAWVPVAQRSSEHYAKEKSIRVGLIEPHKQYEAFLGFNLAAYKNWPEILKQVKESGQPGLINPISFNLASGRQVLSTLVMPVYHYPYNQNAGSVNGDSLQGYLAMFFDDEKLINKVLESARQEKITLKIIEYDAATPLETNLNVTDYGFQQILQISVLGRAWIFIYQPSDKFINSHTTFPFWWVFIAVFCVVGLLGFTLLSVTGQILQTQIQVNEKTSELNNKHRLLESILNNVREGIVACDRNGRLTMLNRTARDHYGLELRNLSPEQWSNYYQLFEVDGQTPLRLESNPLYQALNGHKIRAGELIMKHTDNSGRDLLVNSQPLVDEHEQIIGAVASFQDITRQKQHINELKKLSLAVQYSPSAVMMTDANGVIEFINEKFIEINGYSADEVKGQTPRILKSGRTPVKEYQRLWKDLLRGKGWQGEFLNQKKNGQLYWAKQFISPVKNEQGKVIHFVCIMEDVTETRKKAEIISYLASHDDLTGLLNRRECEKRLERIINSARQNKNRHVFCFLDLDKFKIVNDTCGHIAGDDLLRVVSELISKHLRHRDTLARLGGDEFGVIMEHCLLPQAKEVAEKICGEFANYNFCWLEHNFKIGVSIGMTEVNQHSVNFTTVMEKADKACYQVKKRGRGRVAIYSQIENV